MRESDVLLALLLHRPDGWVTADKLVGVVYAEQPDLEPPSALNIIRVEVAALRRHGVNIQTRPWWGYRIPAEARGLHARPKSAE